MTALKLGISLPAITDLADLAAAGGVAAAARHVEQLGFESVWTADLIIGDGTPALDSTIVLAAAAGATERVRLGFGVYVLPLVPAAWTAARIATLQYVSGNRVLFGVGTGGFPEAPFWAAVDVPAHERGRRTDEALEVLPGLIAGSPTRVRPDGSPLTLAPGVPVPPILVGGGAGDRVLRRTVRYGDEWFPSLVLPHQLTRGAARLRELADSQGRPMPGITVGGHASLTNDRSAADPLAQHLSSTYAVPLEEAAKVPVTGSTAEVAERLAGYAEVGVRRVVLGLDGGDFHGQAERLAEAYALLT